MNGLMVFGQKMVIFKKMYLTITMVIIYLFDAGFSGVLNLDNVITKIQI